MAILEQMWLVPKFHDAKITGLMVVCTVYMDIVLYQHYNVGIISFSEVYKMKAAASGWGPQWLLHLYNVGLISFSEVYKMKAAASGWGPQWLLHLYNVGLISFSEV